MRHPSQRGTLHACDRMYGLPVRLGRRTAAALDPQHPVELRGDAILYLLDDVHDPGVEDILGSHAENAHGIPFGFVYTAISDRLGEPWSVTLSHEALELLGDANVNKLAAGPDPRDPKHPDRYVLHWFEMCDAVQSESYKIDGVAVSNFVTPLYFTIGEQDAGRNEAVRCRRSASTRAGTSGSSTR